MNETGGEKLMILEQKLALTSSHLFLDFFYLSK
jgi:hypothetical protein